MTALGYQFEGYASAKPLMDDETRVLATLNVATRRYLPDVVWRIVPAQPGRAEHARLYTMDRPAAPALLAPETFAKLGKAFENAGYATCFGRKIDCATKMRFEGDTARVGDNISPRIEQLDRDYVLTRKDALIQAMSGAFNPRPALGVRVRRVVSGLLRRTL